LTVAEARAAALRQPGAREGSHHGHPDFRVGSRIFATLWPSENRSVLRLPVEFAESLESGTGDAFRIVSRAGGQGWVSASLADLDAGEFEELMAVAVEHLTAGKPERS